VNRSEHYLYIFQGLGERWGKSKGEKNLFVKCRGGVYYANEGGTISINQGEFK